MRAQPIGQSTLYDAVIRNRHFAYDLDGNLVHASYDFQNSITCQGQISDTWREFDLHFEESYVVDAWGRTIEWTRQDDQSGSWQFVDCIQGAGRNEGATGTSVGDLTRYYVYDGFGRQVFTKVEGTYFLYLDIEAQSQGLSPSMEQLAVESEMAYPDELYFSYDSGVAVAKRVFKPGVSGEKVEFTEYYNNPNSGKSEKGRAIGSPGSGESLSTHLHDSGGQLVAANGGSCANAAEVLASFGTQHNFASGETDPVDNKECLALAVPKNNGGPTGLQVQHDCEVEDVSLLTRNSQKPAEIKKEKFPPVYVAGKKFHEDYSVPPLDSNDLGSQYRTLAGSYNHVHWVAIKGPKLRGCEFSRLVRFSWFQNGTPVVDGSTERREPHPGLPNGPEADDPLLGPMFPDDIAYNPRRKAWYFPFGGEGYRIQHDGMLDLKDDQWQKLVRKGDRDWKILADGPGPKFLGGRDMPIDFKANFVVKAFRRGDAPWGKPKARIWYDVVIEIAAPGSMRARATETGKEVNRRGK